MMKPVALVGALFAAAQPAFGLSCFHPDPVEIFAAGTSETILVGRLAFEDEVWPGPGEMEDPFEIGFEGVVLTEDGFVPAGVTRITLQFACQDWGCGPWTDQPTGFFATGDAEQGYQIVVDACFGTVFGPSPDVMDRLANCAEGVSCTWPTYD